MAVANGGVGGVTNPSLVTNTVAVNVGGIQATVVYAGLAPGLPALYLLKVTIPPGVTAGDVFLDIAGVDW